MRFFVFRRIKAHGVSYWIRNDIHHAMQRQTKRWMPALSGLLVALSLAASGHALAAEPEQPSCNDALAEATLKARLRTGPTIDLVCKTHPLHNNRMIVALFHELSDKPGEVREDAKGFAMAIIDTDQNKILQLYRNERDIDASIRISSGSLRLDTARYNLAPGVRALGVRMNIESSPSCAEGGQNDLLSLFVEEGATLRPVLEDLAMSQWTQVEGTSCGAIGARTVVDRIARELVVLPGVTDGWHDLQVVARHTIETHEGLDAAKPVRRTEKEKTLRAKGKAYPGL